MATQLGQAPQQAVHSGPPVNVRVTASKDPAGTVIYNHDWDFGGPVKTGKIEVPRGTPPTNIKFHLTDRTGLNLSFYPTPSDAFYIDFAPSCPVNAGNARGEFDLSDPPSSSSNNLLTVKDMNRTECELKYALRFNGDPYTDSNGVHPPYAYDPDLKNGGGGTVSSINISAILGVAVMTAIAVTALVWLVRA